jgi:phage tail-like protein
MAADERVDPIARFRYAVEIEGIVAGYFAECGGLTVEREVIPRPEGGVNDYVYQLPGRVSYSRITLKRGIADNVLWNWFQKGLYDGQVERHNVSIILYNVDRTEAKRWSLADAYPVKWTGPDFQADSDQLGIETLEIGSGSGGTTVQRAKAEGEASAGQETPAEQEQGVDLPALAVEVYNLLRQKLRLEQERLGRNRL